MLPWYLSGNRGTSWENPSSRATTWCRWRVSGVHLLLGWPSSWGVIASSQGWLYDDIVYFVFFEFLPWLVINERSWFGYATRCEHIEVMFPFAVPCIDWLGWQRSMGTNWAWKSLWKFWICWRFYRLAWRRPLPSGCFLSFLLHSLWKSFLNPWLPTVFFSQSFSSLVNFLKWWTSSILQFASSLVNFCKCELVGFYGLQFGFITYGVRVAGRGTWSCESVGGVICGTPLWNQSQRSFGIIGVKERSIIIVLITKMVSLLVQIRAQL